MPAERRVDVRALPAPEPMQQVLRALARLDAGDHLRVLHRRQPFPLYGMLAELGCSYRVCDGADGGFEILIWHVGDAQATAACGPADEPPARPDRGCR